MFFSSSCFVWRRKMSATRLKHQIIHLFSSLFPVITTSAIGAIVWASCHFLITNVSMATLWRSFQIHSIHSVSLHSSVGVFLISEPNLLISVFYLSIKLTWFSFTCTSRLEKLSRIAIRCFFSVHMHSETRYTRTITAELSRCMNLIDVCHPILSRTMMMMSYLLSIWVVDACK